MPFRSGKPRKPPFPGDAKIGTMVVRLGKSTKDQTGLVIQRQPDLDVVRPTSFDYGSLDPKYERIQEYRTFKGGFGLKYQDGFTVDQYYYAVGADLSQNPWILGPSISSITPTTTDATNGILGFFDYNSFVYANAGRYVLKRTADTAGGWGVDQDLNALTAAATGLEAITFYSNALSSNYIVVAMSTGNFAYYTGAAWAVAAGVNMDRRCFVVSGRDLYGVRNTNTLCKVGTDSDFTNSANWTDITNIGDRSSAVNRMFILPDGTFIALKTDGPYTVDVASGDSVKLFRSLSFAPSTTNGLGNGNFLNDYYVPYSQGLYKITVGAYYGVGPKVNEAGPEAQSIGSDAAVRGKITAFLGHDTFHAYGGIYNGTDSYLMKMNPDGVWHGAISQAFSNVKITSLFKSSNGAVASHTRLYIGFSDGSLAYFTLPNDPFPGADSSYTFNTTTGIAYMPLFTGGFGADTKALHSATVAGVVMNGNQYTYLDYTTIPTATSWTTLSGNFDSVPRERIDFPQSTSTSVGSFRLNMLTLATTASPQVTALAIMFYRRVPLARTFTLSVLAENGLLKRDGTPFRYGADYIRSTLQGYYGQSAAVTLILPDESTVYVTITNYQESQAWDDHLKQWLASIQLEMAEYTATTVGGTYAALEAYTYAQLENLGSYAAMETAAVP